MPEVDSADPSWYKHFFCQQFVGVSNRNMGWLLSLCRVAGYSFTLIELKDIGS
jgi:hypothetical protein